MTLTKKVFFYILTLIISIFILLIFDFTLSNTIISNKNCYNFEEYYYELKKNCKTKERFKKSFPKVDIITDNHGLRISKSNLEKKGDKNNILIFGDSFTYGTGLEYEKTYAGLIEKKLSNFNYYNFAVPSYSPTVHLFKLKQAIKLGIIPNKILLFLDLTDVIDESTRWQGEGDKKPKLYNKEIFDREKKDFSEKNFKITKDIVSNINFYSRLIRSKVSNIFSDTVSIKSSKKIKTSIQGQFTYTEPAKLNKSFWNKRDLETGLNKIKDNINNISMLSKDHNSQFFLIIYPWAETLEFGENQFNWSNFGKTLCQNEKCKLINAIPKFIQYKENNKNWSNELYFINDEHFSSKGALLLSEIVIEQLMQE